jgi:hypothetical protein
MQTTLRIHDALYREAKAQAARAGISLTKYIEDALREKIGQQGSALREAAPDYETNSPSKQDLKALDFGLAEFVEAEEVGAEEAWDEELKARLELVRSGKAKTRPLEDFMRELERRLHQ